MTKKDEPIDPLKLELSRARTDADRYRLALVEAERKIEKLKADLGAERHAHETLQREILDDSEAPKYSSRATASQKRLEKMRSDLKVAIQERDAERAGHRDCHRDLEKLRKDTREFLQTLDRLARGGATTVDMIDYGNQIHMLQQQVKK